MDYYLKEKALVYLSTRRSFSFGVLISYNEFLRCTSSLRFKILVYLMYTVNFAPQIARAFIKFYE